MARRRVSEPGCNGPRIWFQLAAHDEHEKIAIGTHKRRVIEAAQIMTSNSAVANGRSWDYGRKEMGTLANE